MHGPRAAVLAACLGAWVLAVGGCAGSVRQTPTAPAQQAAATPAPAASTAAQSPGLLGAADPSPGVPGAAAQSSAMAGAAGQSAGGSSPRPSTQSDSAAIPGAAESAGPASIAGPGGAAGAAEASAPAATGLPAAGPSTGGVAAGSAPSATPEPGQAPATTATPAGPDDAPPATSAAIAPAPSPTPRVMLADELPYSPAHLRARDAKLEHHHGREASRDGRESGKRPYHPAPGIVVDVVDAQGGATAAAVQRTARNLGYWPFRQCYEEGLRREQHLAGKVSLELVVSPSGAVDRSVVTATTMRDEIVAACVAREAQRLALPSGESPTTARVDVSLAVGDEPVATGRPVPNAEPIRQSLRGSWSAARRCYASKLASHPGLGGRMELHFHVRHGEIVDVDELAGAGESGGHFGDADVTRCVLGVYRTARLPTSHGSRERSFVYALHFESAPVDVAAR
jgi:hypothetical protein